MEVMSKRKIEMHHYRQALLRRRQGDSDRDISRSGLMGRRTAASLRTLASARGWLAGDLAAPDDATIAEGLAPARRAATTVSSLEAHRERIAAWLGQGVSGGLPAEHKYLTFPLIPILGKAMKPPPARLCSPFRTLNGANWRNAIEVLVRLLSQRLSRTKQRVG